MSETRERQATQRPRLSVLMVEDSRDDARLNALALEQAGYELHWERVEDAEAMANALARIPGTSCCAITTCRVLTRQGPWNS